MRSGLDDTWQTARATWALCVKKLRTADYDLLVFDELVYVLSYDMLPVAEVLDEIRSARERQPSLHIVVTGRDAPKELVQAFGEMVRSRAT